jgi:hypothetical protein
MSRRLGGGVYVVWFGAGLVFDVAAWGACRALGAAVVSVTVDWAVGLVGGAFALSLLTGINLGLPESIRNVGGDAGSLVSPRRGLCLLLFSIAVFFVGPVISAILQ